MLRFFVRRWFLIALVAVLAVGFWFCEALSLPAAKAPRQWIVAGVLFVTALPLELRAMWRAVRDPRPASLAVAINSLVVPPLAWIIAPLLAKPLAIGLIVTASVPCTLASAAVWTRRAGGNDAPAILVTLVTNLTCFVVTPAWLILLVGQTVQLDLSALASRLALVVVVPIMAAQILRICGPVAAWATGHKTLLGVVAQCGILSMVFLGAIRSGIEIGDTGAALRPGAWAIMLAAVALVHLGALGLGHVASWRLGLDRPDRIAVGFAGSQKTLMVGLDIGLQFFGGLTILPMVAYHVSQLLIDTVIADRIGRHDPPSGSQVFAAKHGPSRLAKDGKRR